MTPIRLTAAQWIDKHRLGVAATLEGRRHVAAHKRSTGEQAYVEVEVDDPDARCALVDGRLDAQDLARVSTGVRLQPVPVTRTMRYVPPSTDGEPTACVYDEATGMAYILD